jgi:hypothetical protein
MPVHGGETSFGRQLFPVSGWGLEFTGLEGNFGLPRHVVSSRSMATSALGNHAATHWGIKCPLSIRCTWKGMFIAGGFTG